MTINRLSGIDFPQFPISAVTPFTYRDGATFLELLTAMRQYVNDVLVPDVNQNTDTVLQNFQSALDQIEILTTPGLPYGTNVENVHVDTYIVDGIYRVLSTEGTVANGYPVAGPGILQVSVVNPVGHFLQEFTTSSERPVVYRRRKPGSGLAWEAWKIYTASRVDETAGRAIFVWDYLNNREQLVHYDSGWRDISGDLLNGYTGNLRIKRVNYEVFVEGVVIPVDATTPSAFYLPTAGFRGNPPVFVRTPGRMVSSSDMFWFKRGGSSEPFTVDSVTPWVPARGGFAISVNYSITEVIPTALPGVQYGTIPNR